MIAFLSTPAGRFRTVAIAEALSWTGLLLGMLVKYVGGGSETGVQIFGPIHGALFVVYVAVTLATWTVFGWRMGAGILALIASIPPFGTLVFERWATRRGLLDTARESAAPTTA